MKNEMALFIAAKDKQFRDDLAAGKKAIHMTGADGSEWDLMRLAWTFYPDTEAEKAGIYKVFLFERVMHPNWSKVQYRFGYYVLARNGHWVWTEKPPMFNADDFAALLVQIVRDNVLLNGDLLVSL